MLAEGEIEEARQALVQKIGENISVRRVATHEADAGVIGGYVHGNNRIAVLVSLKAGSEELARDVAMHVAAVNPQVVSPDDMPQEAGGQRARNICRSGSGFGQAARNRREND